MGVFDAASLGFRILAPLDGREREGVPPPALRETEDAMSCDPPRRREQVLRGWTRTRDR